MALELAEWVDRVFGQADPRDLSKTCDALKEFFEPNEETLLKLIEVFENPAKHLNRYSDEVLDQALWGLKFEAFHIVYEETIDWDLRRHFIRSLEILYRELLAPRCSPSLGHLSEEGQPLNSACYMLWHNVCWEPTVVPLAQNRYDSAFLEALRTILAIDHTACQESALHGLGHWHEAHGAAVENIINEFLQRHPNLVEPLRKYAEQARHGAVQ
jgi:hypothetical protein